VVKRLAELLGREDRRLDGAARRLLDVLGPRLGRRHQRMAGGSQIEIFRSDRLSWATAAVPVAARRSQRQSELLHGRPSKLFVTPTVSAHDNSANRVYERRAMDITLASGMPHSTWLVACLDKGQPLDDALVPPQGASPASKPAPIAPSSGCFLQHPAPTGEIDENPRRPGRAAVQGC